MIIINVMIITITIIIIIIIMMIFMILMIIVILIITVIVIIYLDNLVKVFVPTLVLSTKITNFFVITVILSTKITNCPLEKQPVLRHSRHVLEDLEIFLPRPPYGRPRERTQYFSGGAAPKNGHFFHFGISDTWSNPHNFKDDFEKKKIN